MSKPKNRGSRHDTDRNLHTIAILPVRLQLQKLTARDGTNSYKVQSVMQTVIPGVKTPKMGISLGHCQIPNSHQDDVESKNSSLVSQWAHQELIN